MDSGFLSDRRQVIDDAISGPSPAGGRSAHVLALTATCVLLTAVPYLLRFPLLRTRTFDSDEFQHLHAAWAVHQGLIPFRDFFEHHMPGIQVLFAPMMDWFDIAGSADDAIRFVFFARIVMAVFAGAAVLLTAWLGREHGGARVASLGAALLSTSLVFLGRTLEIRPDTPSLALWVASLAALSCAVNRAPNRPATSLWFGLSGLCFGTALAFNQKLLLAAPGLAIWGLVYVTRQPRNRDPRTVIGRQTVAHVAAFACAAAVPLLGVAAWFWSEGAFVVMVRGSLAANLGWPREVSAKTTLAWMALRDPVLSALAIGGFVRQGLMLMHERWTATAGAALWLAGVSLLVFFFVTPTPFPQYLLLVLPIGAVFGAQLLWAVVCEMPQGRALIPGGTAAETATIAVSFLATLFVGIAVARPVYLHPLVYPLVAVVSVIVASVFSVRKYPELAAAVLLLAGSSYSLQQIRWMQGLSNASQLAEMRWLHEQTGPKDSVLDGFSGLAWFRPYASFYGFLHPGVRAFLTKPQVETVIVTLTDCAAPPRIVILDANLRALSPDVERLVADRYRATGMSNVWLRDDDVRSCGNGP